MWVFLALLIVPIIEIALFIQVGGWLTLWPTLGLVVLTAVLGTWILRVQGAQAMAELREKMNTLSDPTAPLAHGAMILVAGVLLLTPGFMTDAFGFALLVPAVRSFIMSRVKNRVTVASMGGGVHMGGVQSGAAANQQGAPQSGARRRPRDRVIDGEFVEVAPETDDTGEPGSARPTHKPSGWTKH